MGMSKFLYTGNVEAPFLSVESSNQITSLPRLVNEDTRGENPPHL